MRCQFCNNHFMTAGHYGRHLRANHSKEQRSKSLHEALPPNLQAVPMTRKRRHLRNLGAANTQAPPLNLQSLAMTRKRRRLSNLEAGNTHSCPHLDRGHNPCNIKSPVSRGSPAAPGGPVASHEQDLQTSTHASDRNHGLDGIKLPDSRGTPMAPDDRVASRQQHLLEVRMVGQVICQSLFIDIRHPSWNPLIPFSNAYEYKLARFFHQSKTSMKQIYQFFHDDLCTMNTSPMLKIGHESGHIWRKKM